MSFDWTPEELQKVVDENKIVIFMKGTPDPTAMWLLSKRSPSDQHGSK